MKIVAPSHNVPIAIVGMAGRLPQAEDPRAFWENLYSGKDTITEIPRERWDWRDYYGKVGDKPNATLAKWGGFIRGADEFDAPFFNISSAEAEWIDPQHRVFLQTAWETIEDAGYRASDLSGRNISVFVGVSTQDYRKHLEHSGHEVSPLASTGMAVSMLANRVSYFFNFKGPSDITDTACSSSFMALHRAIRSIREEGCEMAIAGGVNLILTPDGMIAFYQAGMLSADPLVRTFDEKANGYVRGEGVGAVLLKPLDKAVEDGDSIYAVVKGCAVNHNGRGYSLTAPDTKGQTQVIVDAFQDAGDVPSETIAYIEAHGTATRVGDHTEIRALKKAFSLLKAPIDRQCKIGALKPNIGHLEAASGMAALFKVLLSMKYGVKLGVKNLENINPSLRLNDSPFYLLADHEVWERQRVNQSEYLPRRASLHSFGFGGVNAHVVLEEYLAGGEHKDGVPEARLFTFSSKTDDALERLIEKYVHFLRSSLVKELNAGDMHGFLRDLSYTLLVGREAFESRVGVIASSVDELLLQLHDWQSNKPVSPSRNSSELHTYLEAWHKGADLDAAALFANGEARRLCGLPTYAFEPHRYWIEGAETGLANIQDLPERVGVRTLRDPARMLNTLKQIIGEFVGEERELETDSSLIAHGLDSLMLTSLKNRLERRFRVSLSFELLGEVPTLSALADYLCKEAVVDVGHMPISELAKAPLCETYPLTDEQLRYWRMQKISLGQEQQSLSIPLLIEIQRELNPHWVEKALRLMIQRQESLRLVFAETDEGVRQRILDHVVPPFTHWTEDDEGGDSVRLLVDTLSCEPWDLETGPLWRVGLCKEKGRTSLFFVMHHIIGDLWSARVFLQELQALILAWEMAQPNPLTALSYGFADFVYRDQLIDEGEKENKRAFWKRLTELPVAPLMLPYKPDRVRDRRYAASMMETHLEEDLLRTLRGAGGDGGWTPFTLYLGALALSLYAQTEQKSILIGIPFENRANQEWESVMGCFATVSFALIEVDEKESIQVLLDRVQHHVMDLRSHIMGLSETAELLQRERRDGNNPIQVMLNYMPQHEFAHFLDAPADIKPVGREFLDFEIALTVAEKRDGGRIILEYAQSLFDVEQMDMFGYQFQQSLHFLLGDHKTALADIFHCDGFLRKRPICIVSTFTADSVQESLAFWGAQLQLNTRVQFAGFNQVFQELLNPESMVRTNASGANVFLLRLSDWLDGEDGEVAKHIAQLESVTQSFIQALNEVLNVSQTPYLLVLCPEDLSRVDQDIERAIVACQEEIVRRFSNSTQVTALSCEALLQQYVVDEVFTPELDALGAIPYTAAFYVALGTQISRWVFARWRPLVKVVVVDGDMTLWKGVVGEDGVEGVVLDKGRGAFQRKLHDLQKNGVLLCLCSKNTEDDVRALLREQPDFLLREDHFISLKANWNRKSENLRMLANELNLGLDSFVFIDDNPLEIADVREHCPEVMAVPFPSDDEKILDFVDHNWFFDLGSSTETDLERTRWMRENLERDQAQQSVSTYAAFLEDLQLQIAVSRMQVEDIARVSQLTQRTNQFNTTTIRKTEEEVRQLMNREDVYVEVVHVKDRFGDYGLVGVMVLGVDQERAVLRSLLLSCRVLGRGVEHAMVVKAAKLTQEQGFEQLDIRFTPSQRNEPARMFLDQLRKAGEKKIVCEVAALKGLRFDPDTLGEDDHSHDVLIDESQSSTIPLGRRIDIDKWLHEWVGAKTPEAFISRLRLSNTLVLPLQECVYPQTQTEIQLASIWERVLNIENVCVEASFYEMGGTSLELVQVLAEIRTVLQIPLPFQLFLAQESIRELALVIERFASTGSFEDDTFPDLLGDAELEEDIRQDIRNADFAADLDRSEPCCVLLTGATGYVGAFLLQELLSQTVWRIACLVRAQDVEDGYGRLEANLKKYGFRLSCLRERVDVVIGDLGQERLGLTESEFERLGKNVAAIYHNGAQVNFTRSYEDLKAANLGGTKACVRLACVSKLKPLFYVSTASVFDSDVFQSDQKVDESTLSPETAKVYGGYAQSKWAAEQVVTQAAECGLPVAIFRPNGIGPSMDPNHARFNDDDAFSLVILASLNLGMFFDLPLHIDFAPVDYVASALVELSLQPFDNGQVYALTNPRPGTLGHVQNLLGALGESVELVDYKTWVDVVGKYARETRHQKLLALLPLMQEPVTSGGESWFELSAKRPRFGCDEVLAKLSEKDIVCPEVNRDTMMKLLLLSFLSTNYLACRGEISLRENATPKTISSAKNTILILSWSLGEGHNTSALAIEQALREANGSQVKIIDLGEYMSFVKNLERFWRHLSRNLVSQLDAYTDVTQSCRQHEHPQFREIYQSTVTDLLTAYQPDAVISVCPLGSQLLNVFKEKAPQTKTATYVSDWFGGTYKEWGDAGADWIYSPSVQCTQFLLDVCKAGDPDIGQRIVTGSAIMRPGFYDRVQTISKAEQKVALGFEPDNRILLFNSYGSLQTLRLLEDLVLPGLHIIVLCYRNKAVLERVSQLDAGYEGRIEGKLWIENLQDWLMACDVVYTKPGPGICAEALMTKSVLFLNAVDGIMPQEVSVYETLLQEELGMGIASSEDFGEAVHDWLFDAPRYQEICKRVEAKQLQDGCAEFVGRIKQDLA